MAIDPATLTILTNIGKDIAPYAIAGGLYNKIFPNKIKQIQMEVIDGMRDRRKRLARMARGDFTGAERSDIERAAEPGLNRLAGNLAQRGLGTSGAGAQVMAQAAVQPYTQAQQGAEQALVQTDTSIAAALAAIPQQPDILSGLGQLAGKFHQIEKLKLLQAEEQFAETGQPGVVESVNIFDVFVQGIMEFLEFFGGRDDFDPVSLDSKAMDAVGRMQ